MGSHCCTIGPDKQSEIQVETIVEESSEPPKKKNKKLDLHLPILKERYTVKPDTQDEAVTPGFADRRSQASRHSDQSRSGIQLVGAVENMADQQMVASQTSTRKKLQGDSPMAMFEPRNSLRSVNSQKLKKLRSQSEERSQHSRKSMVSQRSMSVDKQSVKSILKQELKYSHFKKMKTTSDANSLKQVRFNVMQK